MTATANLTSEQLAWENDWFDRFMGAADSLDVEKWIRPFCAKEAIWIHGNAPALHGAEAIEAFMKQAISPVSSMKHTNMRRSFDVARQIIFQETDVIYVLAPDPEKKEFVIPGSIVVQKPLGVQQEKLNHAQVYLDISPLFARLAELEAAKQK